MLLCDEVEALPPIRWVLAIYAFSLIQVIFFGDTPETIDWVLAVPTELLRAFWAFLPLLVIAFRTHG